MWRSVDNNKRVLLQLHNVNICLQFPQWIIQELFMKSANHFLSTVIYFQLQGILVNVRNNFCNTGLKLRHKYYYSPHLISNTATTIGFCLNVQVSNYNFYVIGKAYFLYNCQALHRNMISPSLRRRKFKCDFFYGLLLGICNKTWQEMFSTEQIMEEHTPPFLAQYRKEIIHTAGQECWQLQYVNSLCSEFWLRSDHFWMPHITLTNCANRSK